MKLSFIIIICISPTCLFAQQNSNDSHKRFGFMAGINTANMNFNKGVPAPSVPIGASWKSGITIGFLVRIPLANKLFMQPEYSYSHRKGSDGSIVKNYALDYISLPVLLNYEICHRVTLLAGPQAELLIHASSYNNTGVKSDITHDVEERGIGATAGLNIQLIKSLFISARYFQGLNHIGIGQRSDIKEFKYEVVNVSLGIEF